MRALILLIAIALFGAGYHLLTPDGRELIDRIAVNLTRADYQARFRAGEALPGTPDLDRIDETVRQIERDAIPAGVDPTVAGPVN